MAFKLPSSDTGDNYGVTLYPFMTLRPISDCTPSSVCLSSVCLSVPCHPMGPTVGIKTSRKSKTGAKISWIILPRTVCASAVLDVIAYPSVRPSVTDRSWYLKSPWAIVRWHNSLETLVSSCESSTKFQRDHPQRGHQRQWSRQKLRFSTGQEVSGSDALLPKICVRPPRCCIGERIRGAINN